MVHFLHTQHATRPSRFCPVCDPSSDDVPLPPRTGWGPKPPDVPVDVWGIVLYVLVQNSTDARSRYCKIQCVLVCTPAMYLSGVQSAPQRLRQHRLHVYTVHPSWTKRGWAVVDSWTHGLVGVWLKG